MNEKNIIQIGSLFSFWKVIKLVKGTKTIAPKALCHCTGCNQTTRAVAQYDLRVGKTKSCGCQAKKIQQETCIEKYGVTSTRKLESNEEKRKQTCLEKYGYINPLQNESIKEKSKLTCLEKYGTEYATQSLEIKKKRVDTCIEKYGTSNIMSLDQFSQKQKETIQLRYGVDNISQLDSIKNRKILTTLKNYGETHHSKTIQGQLDRKRTCLEKYGVDNISKLEANKLIVHPKRRATNLDRYGVEHPTQDLNIAIRSVRTRRNRFTRLHWKTNEELTCIGSYEVKTVDYLNENKTEFSWQPRIFKLSTGRTYRPDLYLTNSDLWIEIKGRFLGESEAKWNEFHTEIQPNSELWNKEKLKEMGIL